MTGADIYPNIGIVLFMIVFFGMVWFALRADKEYIHELEQIPLNDSEPNQ